MIAIVTVNWGGYDWLNLLIQSVSIFSTEPYRIVVVDNNTAIQRIQTKEIIQIMPMGNIGHGEGLNEGMVEAAKLYPEFIMALDVDCHFLKSGWEKAFRSMMYEYDIVAGRGVPVKPIRPACMFMRPWVGTKYDWRATKDYKGNRVTPEGRDVAIGAYYKIKEENTALGFIESRPSRYKTLNGEEWCVNGVPYVYHHWHGTHLTERQVDFPEHDLLADKDRLFGQIPWQLI